MNQYMEKKITFIDMDGVLADFRERVQQVEATLGKKHEDKVDEMPFVFRDLNPIDGAVEAVKKLHHSGKYDLYIASTSPWKNPTALQDKKDWIQKHFGDIFYKKVFFAHNKNLLCGDYLIDDRLKNGAGMFKGQLLRFGIDYETGEQNEFPGWDAVLKHLLPDE